MKSRYLVAAALALAITATSTSTASATRAFPLRVEAPGVTLDPGTYYAPRSPIAGQRGELAGAGECIRAQGDIPLAGQGALGLIASAANANEALRPTLIAEDAFGRRLCRVGTFNETDVPFTGWLFRVNHVAPPVSADLVALKGVDEVLWVFANFGTGANTGDELVLEAPVQNAPGTIQVQVTAVTFDGKVAAAPDGTVVSGGTSPVTTTAGIANVPVGVRVRDAEGDRARYGGDPDPVKRSQGVRVRQPGGLPACPGADDRRHGPARPFQGHRRPRHDPDPRRKGSGVRP